MIERGIKIYIWNELHSFVVLKYKHSSFNFRKIANRGNEEIYIILFVKEVWTSYLRMSTHKVGEHNVFEQKFLWSFIDFFCFLYTQLSRKAIWKWWSFTILYDKFNYVPQKKITQLPWRSKNIDKNADTTFRKERNFLNKKFFNSPGQAPRTVYKMWNLN